MTVIQPGVMALSLLQRGGKTLGERDVNLEGTDPQPGPEVCSSVAFPFKRGDSLDFHLFSVLHGNIISLPVLTVLEWI